MKTRVLWLLAAVMLPVALSDAASPADISRQPGLRAFANEAELHALLKRWQDEAKKRRAEALPRLQSMASKDGAAAAQSPPAAAPAAAAAKSDAAAESLTNTQVAGVDEGGIVKRHGDHLVVLRRGRLFTVALSGNRLQPVASIDAFGPDIDPRGAWYDEMLLSGDTVIVIGYSYARGGTEIGLFDIDRAGGLRYRATYHLRSNDYYASRNYASRLIGSTLIFYTPLYLNLWDSDPLARLPGMRRWRGDKASGDFRRIAPATRIFRAADDLDPANGVALHSVIACDLAQRDMSCEASAVLGPSGRVFHVSAQAVYIWTSDRPRDPVRRNAATVFRLPLDGGRPAALKASGQPVDQFSFLEADGHLNVMLRASGRRESMWGAEQRSGDAALLRVPLTLFGDGSEATGDAHYRPLPPIAAGAMQNRYVGKYLLYGTSTRRPASGDGGEILAVRYGEPGELRPLKLSHGVERIEALGGHALVIGSNGPDLHFSSLRLDGEARVAHRHVRADAAQGETRSHGFFYKADGPADGTLGLPVIGTGDTRRRGGAAAAVLFLRNAQLKLAEIGALEAGAAATSDDGCRASCVDWYGNARPLFIGDRVFALLGYEIVEGRIEASSPGGRNGMIREVQRASFAPPTIGFAR